MARTTTPMEAPTVNAWKALAYHGYGICANPACGELTHCCGVNPASRVCLPCFEFVYHERPPRLKVGV